MNEKDFVVSGYQADIDFGNTFAGILYEEKVGYPGKTRTKVTINADSKDASRFGDEAGLASAIHPGEWNDFRVVANGNHLNISSTER